MLQKKWLFYMAATWHSRDVLHCSNKSFVPCIRWTTGCWRQLQHKWHVNSCGRTADKIPANLLHWVDTCWFQLQRDWRSGA